MVGVSGSSPDELVYSERLWPSASTWLLVPLFAALVAAVLAAFSPWAAALGAVSGAGVTIVSLVHASARVQVWRQAGLQAARAHVPSRFLDGAHGARGPAARAMRGPELDARTHLCLRGWVDGVVLVHLDDPDDPTPSWLVSTRQPETLSAAIDAVSVGRAATG